MLKHSALQPETASFRHIIGAGDYLLEPVRSGQIIRIVDLYGNQAADTLFYNVADTAERYSAVDTMLAQANIYLTTGTTLISTEGRAMLTIVADTVGRHDTLGGACASESNTVRYDLEKRHMHSCRDSWMLAVTLNDRHGLSRRDITHNINFFMNVPVTEAGDLDFADGLSAPGNYVELQAEMDVLVLISNCPQLNNPCNGYNPTPIEILIWDAA